MIKRSNLHDNLTLSSHILSRYLEERAPCVGLILGSGLNSLGEEVEDAVKIPFEEIPCMKSSTAEGHVGQFVCGRLAGVEVLCMQGRLHGYEGNSAQEVAYPVWLMSRLGINILITTNAAGAINEAYQVGDFCVMSDQINFTGRNPVADADPADISERFFSMTEAFDADLRSLALSVAKNEKIRLHEGVYLGLLGPSFETPAEIKMFRIWGADTVAMSVVEEVIAARHTGMRVMGISLISNMAAGIGGSSPDGEEVLDVGKQREFDFARLIKGIVGQIR